MTLKKLSDNYEWRLNNQFQFHLHRKLAAYTVRSKLIIQNSFFGEDFYIRLLVECLLKRRRIIHILTLLELLVKVLQAIVYTSNIVFESLHCVDKLGNHLS